MDISKLFNKRWGNSDGYKDGVIYTEVLNDIVYKTYQNGVIRYKKRVEKGAVTSESEVRNNLEWLVPKIPFKYYLMTLDFYKDVEEKYGTEACVLFYWNKDNLEIPENLLEKYGSGIIQDGQLIVIAPKQKNSSTLSQFVETISIGNATKTVLTPMVKWLEDNTTCIMETHSHNSMEAFWSPTDDANERHSRLRLFTVIGKVNGNEMVKCRVHSLGEYFDLNIEDVFEMPTIRAELSVEGLDFDASSLIPSNFKEQVYTGPFKYKETHPESWFELFSVRGSSYNKNKPNKYFSNLDYLDDDDDDIDVDTDVDIDAIDVDLEGVNQFDTESFRLSPDSLSKSKRNKSILDMNDAEYKRFIRNGLI